MGITTSTSIESAPLPRCGACGGLARGGLRVQDANGRAVAICCATPRQKTLLEDLIGDAPEPVEAEGLPIAADVLDMRKGRQ